MKKILVFTAILISNLDIFGQATIKIDKSNHDFGEVFEGDPASIEFTVENTGKSPLIISSVQPSCGCTTPEWTKSPIAPGEKGIIKATYGTAGRPGNFNKSIAVYSNDELAPNKTLYIRGVVVKKETNTYTKEQLSLSPKIVVEKSEQNFGIVEKGTKLPFKINVKNLGRSDLKISSVAAACNCIQTNKLPDYIKVGESVIIDGVYNALNLGEISDVVILKSNDISNPSFRFSLKGKVVESIANPSIMKENKTSVPFK